MCYPTRISMKVDDGISAKTNTVVILVRIHSDSFHWLIEKATKPCG
jgi:hypothetical protein